MPQSFASDLLQAKAVRTSFSMEQSVSRNKGPRGCCNKIASHVERRWLASGAGGPSRCHGGDGGVVVGWLTHVALHDSDPAAAGRMAHPLTGCGGRHVCSVDEVVRRLRKRRCCRPCLSFTAGAGLLLPRAETRLHSAIHRVPRCWTSETHFAVVTWQAW